MLLLDSSHEYVHVSTRHLEGMKGWQRKETLALYRNQHLRTKRKNLNQYFQARDCEVTIKELDVLNLQASGLLKYTTDPKGE